MRFLQLLVILLPVAASALEPVVKVRDVSLDAQRSRVIAKVQGAVPVTITLEPGPGSENCALAGPLTRVATKPGELVLAELRPVDPSKRWSCTWRYTTNFGDSTRAAAEECQLGLPFRPEGRYRVVQGFDGALTHKDRVRHALDFSMPEGTPVLAARDGVVTFVLDDDQHGTRLGGNAVTLLHPDGTLTQYAHLQRGSVQVREGQALRRGAVLGLSGSTNLTPVQPHLHFEVFLEPGTARRTVPFKMLLSDGTCREATEGDAF